MDIRKIIFIIIFLISFFVNTKAFAFNKEYQVKSNEAIWDIYKRILEVKKLYPELREFSKNVVIKNDAGFNEIVYSFEPSDDDPWQLEDEPYAFKLSIKPQELENSSVQSDSESQDWQFPLLGLKVGLEVSHLGQMVTFDPRPIVERGLQRLILAEQGYFPFRLEVVPDKDVYEISETITVTIRLKNLGIQAYRVLDLDENSLYCQMDDIIWGSEPPQETVETVLPSHGNLTKILKVKGISSPKQAEIFCRYGMSFKGVRPYGQAVIRIKPLP